MLICLVERIVTAHCRLPFAVYPLAGILAEVVHSTVVRSVAAAVSVALVSWACGPAAIRWLARRFLDPVKSASAELDRLHRAKASTPTMGGIFLVAAIAVASLVFADPGDRWVVVSLMTALGLALVGAIDDLVKLRSRRNGLGWKAKLAAQACVAALPAMCFARGWCGAAGHVLLLPAGAHVQTNWLAIPWIMLLVVGTSNAVNLADGLDGLVATALLPTTVAVAVVAGLFGRAEARELVVVAGATVGGLLGFLRYNRYPARVFMGNVGSLPLGGLLAVLAIGPGVELVLPIAAGLFVVETLSVVLQIGWYKRFGRRLLRCAPLHHHFEFAGWPERQIAARFCLASTACALAAIALSLSLWTQARNAALVSHATTIAAREWPPVASATIQAYQMRPE
jgi:phospho-N-acetylmuramoyl-pentapeptide-transferase